MSYFDNTGFHKDSLADIKARLEAGARAIFGDDIDLDPESPDGQYIAFLAGQFADGHNLAEKIYNSIRPSEATGDALTGLMQINGINRQAGEPSVATLTLTGTPGTPVKAGSLVAHKSESGVVFQTTTDERIAANGTATASAVSTVNGAIAAEEGTLTRILTVTSGWSGVTNPSPAIPGSVIESDPTARVRRQKSVALASQGLVDGLEGALLLINTPANPVKHAKLYENPLGQNREFTFGGSVTHTMPPHSIWAVVDGGADDEIANTLWVRRALGCTMKGEQLASVTDRHGEAHVMRWDRPVDRPVYVRVTLTMSGSLTDELVAAVRTAIFNWASDTLDIAAPVRWWQMMQALTPALLGDGVTVASIQLSTDGTSWAAADVPVDANEIARITADQITVTVA